MKNVLAICLMLIFSACWRHKVSNVTVISLSYRQKDIQKEFDTLYNHQKNKHGAYKGIIEQALAVCHNDEDRADTATQDVFSSMYLNHHTGQYDCVTTTTFKFPNGSISATGVFNLKPGDTIAPDHDFPIIGGSAAFSNIYGTYTRKYQNGIYHVELRYFKLK
ncbi:hypothetical protein HDF24_17855 [Mucilaginibacter sp. X4EP1]|uniref:hypothetical protein n=1 Tax=Mucilaginibacter sp. X4EP1 TaxID=2723092 RepID=UPI002166F23E|nr:hypothetical protein [Mucilaginibacter sp. X4EP1]MCS3813566.1 hypothetical protein [Mucilaginibacter sp. X4EP1]